MNNYQHVRDSNSSLRLVRSEQDTPFADMQRNLDLESITIY